MSYIMIGVISLLNTALDTGFLLRWGRAFAIAWPIALTIVLLLGLYVRSIAERLCTQDG